MKAPLPTLTPSDQRQLATLRLRSLPALMEREGPRGWRAFLNFFGATIRNDNTRAAYLQAVTDFLGSCERSGIRKLQDIEPFMVGAYLKHLESERHLTKPSLKVKLAAVRRFFDHLVVEQVVPQNPALSVRGPRLKIRKGKTPVLSLDEVRQLLSTIDQSTLVGVRDFAWLTLALTSWCRVQALANLRVRDYVHSGKRSFVRVHEKGGEVDVMPVHHKAQEAVDALIDFAGIADAKTEPIFQSTNRSGLYTGRALSRHRVFEMVRRRAQQAGISANISTHAFRATGITEFIRAGGRLERAQRRAHHADSRTTKVYDHSDDDVTLEDVELVQF